MKYLNILLAVLFMACSTESTENTETIEEVAPVEEVVATPEVKTVVETIYIKESDIDADNEVKVAFESMVEALNSTTVNNVENLFAFVDEDYVFKGKTREENIARLTQQLEKYEATYTNVRVQGIGSSCDLAYVIASFKKSITERETGVNRVDGLDKVGLFIMRKGDDGMWRLLVQKTDDGFAHWFYMPESN